MAERRESLTIGEALPQGVLRFCINEAEGEPPETLEAAVAMTQQILDALWSRYQRMGVLQEMSVAEAEELIRESKGE